MRKRVNFKRFLLVLALFSSTVSLVAGVLVLTSKASTGSTVYLPAILGGSGSAPPPLPPPTGGPLVDGETVTNAAGVTVGAVSGALSNTVQVTITQVAAPPEALFPGATPHGNYYKIQAGADTFAPLDNPFILGLPVPIGVPTANLALAALVPAGQILDYDSTAPLWSPLLGVYDAIHDLFIITLGGLTKEGLTFVLIEDDQLDTLQSKGAALSAKNPESVAFVVECVGFADPTKCTSVDVQYVVDRLTIDYGDLITSLKFKGPAISSRIGGLDPVTGKPTANSFNEFYDIFIKPIDTCPGIIGQYQPVLRSMFVCKNPNTPLSSNAMNLAIRHEFFHAIQYAYRPVYNSSSALWIIEGTADAAMLSNTTMARNEERGGLRAVDIGLTVSQTVEIIGSQSITDTLHPYRAQDFWVYLGLKNNQGLDYLQPMFEKGADDQDAVDTYGDGDHLEVYWDWAKNQAMEKTKDFDGALTNPCSLQADVVENQIDVHFDHQQSLAYPIGSVDPLNTAVVEIIWDGSYDIADGMVIPTGGLGDTKALEALRYKFYRDGEGGCEAIPDGRRLFEAKDGEISPNLDYYVLISNIDPVQAHPYTVFFEVAPIPPN